MSTTATVLSLPLISRRVRAYFAPVNRVLKQATIFDPALNAAFDLDAPPTPWVDLGWIEGFQRESKSIFAPLTTGSPAIAAYQVRESADARVTFSFKVWSKLTMALTASAQHMNVLAAPSGAAATGSGAKAIAALPLGIGSSASSLILGGSAAFAAGEIISVDADYLGQTGFVGSGVSAAYVSNPSAVNNDVDYVRRVSFNVGRVVKCNRNYSAARSAPACRHSNGNHEGAAGTRLRRPGGRIVLSGVVRCFCFTRRAGGQTDFSLSAIAGYKLSTREQQCPFFARGAYRTASSISRVSNH